MTATVILQMVEEGVLSLNTPASRFPLLLEEIVSITQDHGTMLCASKC